MVSKIAGELYPNKLLAKGFLQVLLLSQFYGKIIQTQNPLNLLYYAVTLNDNKFPGTTTIVIQP